MLDRKKVLEFFDATDYKDIAIHVVGCGAIGSHVCEELARLGFMFNIHLYDFDTVAAHNITNQMFTFNQIGMKKVDACAQMMSAINPDIQLTLHRDGLQAPWICNGIIILAVDSIEVRKSITSANMFNPFCKAIMDFRMRLTDAQYYFASRTPNGKELQNLLATMQFTHDEAKAATPTSACGVELSVIYTVKLITAVGMANLIKYLLEQDYKKLILIDTNHLFTMDAF